MSKGQSYSAIRMICPNENCINKSIIYRRYDVMKDQLCKKCNTRLIVANQNSKQVNKQNQKARNELRELNG